MNSVFLVWNVGHGIKKKKKPDALLPGNKRKCCVYTDETGELTDGLWGFKEDSSMVL